MLVELGLLEQRHKAVLEVLNGATLKDVGAADSAEWRANDSTRRRSRDCYQNSLPVLVTPDPSRPRYIITEPGVGYRLMAPAAS